MKSKTADVHVKYAVALEDEGRLAEAEQNYLLANKPTEAVHM